MLASTVHLMYFVMIYEHIFSQDNASVSVNKADLLAIIFTIIFVTELQVN